MDNFPTTVDVKEEYAANGGMHFILHGKEDYKYESQYYCDRAPIVPQKPTKKKETVP